VSTQAYINELLETIESLSQYEDSDTTDLFIELEAAQSRFDLRTSIQNCTSCNLRKFCDSPTPFTGDTSEVIVAALGEFSGPNEFVKLSAQATNVKIDEYLGLCCCKPSKPRIPTQEEINACLCNLQSQIAILQPWIILTFGALPLENIATKKLKVTRDHGVLFSTIFPDSVGNPIWGYSFFNPGSMQHNLSARNGKDSKALAARNFCSEWEEDWHHVSQILAARKEFGAEVIYPEMIKARKEAPYVPGAPEITKSQRTTYLQRMEMNEKDNDEVPF
jgi:uracil-DNA glycosylase family 4